MESHFHEAICLAAVEILGEKEAYNVMKAMGISSFSNASSSRYSLAELGRELAHRYDPQIAMGLLIRLGRASLTFLRRSFPMISELGAIENRLKPVDKRFPFSLNVMAEVAGAELGSTITVTGQSGLSYDWKVETADPYFTPYYHFGLLEEFCYWLDSRKDYQIAYAIDPSDSGLADLNIKIKELE